MSSTEPVLLTDPLPAELQIKLATILWYLTDTIHKPDPKGFEHALRDPQLTTWLDRMNKAGCINRTAFINQHTRGL